MAISKNSEQVADVAPHHCTPVIIGGLKGQVVYDDESFDDIDPDIQRMFYGASQAYR